MKVSGTTFGGNSNRTHKKYKIGQDSAGVDQRCQAKPIFFSYKRKAFKKRNAEKPVFQ